MDETDTSMGFASLPPELLTQIALFVDIDTLSSVAQTCCSTRNVIQNNPFWKRVWSNTFGGLSHSAPNVNWKIRTVSAWQHYTKLENTDQKITWAICGNMLTLMLQLLKDPTVLVSVDKYLLYAVQENKIDCVRLFLKYGVSLDSVGQCCHSSLGEAVELGHLDIAQVLIAAGAKMQVAGSRNMEAFCATVSRGREKIVSLILDTGVSPNFLHPDGSSLLYVASQNGYPGIVAKLLQAGAVVEFLYRGGFTPLYIAAAKGHVQVLSLLLRAGGVFEYRSPDGSTPLYVACQNGHFKCVKMLVEAGANLETRFLQDFSPLEIAAYNGYSRIVRYLCRLNVAVDIRSLMWATRYGRYAAAKVLLNFVSPNHRDICPLYEAVCHGHFDLTRLLLKNGANPNWADSRGVTILMRAAIKNDVASTKLLISHGAELELKCNASCTALQYARYWKSINTLQALLAAGATPII